MGGLLHLRSKTFSRRFFLLSLIPMLLLLGCELDEVSLTEPENVLVAEVYLKVGDGPDELSAFLQWTLGSAGSTDLLQAVVAVEGPEGRVIPLIRGGREDCLVPEILDDVDGACFVAPGSVEGILAPGDRVELQITLPDGGSVYGGVVLPGDFHFLEPIVNEPCALPPGQPLELIWNPSGGAWAYAGETLIWGLRDALAPLGLEVEEDSLSLTGLSVSETDTTMVFPGEFGVFDRFDLDRDLALVLQEGLPLGAHAEVVIAALERNYVNWVRGGNFNPSGAVRIPSLRGDGTGVLGAVVRRMIRVVGAEPGGEMPSCLPGG